MRVAQYEFDPAIVYNLGFAGVDKLFLRKSPDSTFRMRAAIPTGKEIVLYASIWQQDDKRRELFPFPETQVNFVRQLSEVCDAGDATLIIRSHLNAKLKAQHFDNVRYFPMKEYPDTVSLLRNSDIRICDWSSIFLDFLLFDRPTILLEVPPPFKDGFSLAPEYRFGKFATEMSDLRKSLANFFADPAHYHSEFHLKHREVLSAVDGHSTDGNSAARHLQRLSQ
jgi:CDP-glycerol glycerophosphotransferase